MNVALIVCACLAWYAVGVSGFIYWWTREYDFGSEEVVVAALAGVSGPLAWLIGRGIHGGSTVYIRRRGL